MNIHLNARYSFFCRLVLIIQNKLNPLPSLSPDSVHSAEARSQRQEPEPKPLHSRKFPMTLPKTPPSRISARPSLHCRP